MTIWAVLLPFVVRFPDVASHKYGLSGKGNFAITCKSEWMWVHKLIWCISATSTSFPTICWKYYASRKWNLVTSRIQIRQDSTRYFWYCLYNLMQHFWNSWSSFMAMQVANHEHWPCVLVILWNVWLEFSPGIYTLWVMQPSCCQGHMLWRLLNWAY